MKRNSNYHFEWLQQDGILAWYDLKQNTNALCIHMPNGLLDIIRDRNIEVTIGNDVYPYSTDVLLSQKMTFDYIFLYDVFDYCDDIKTLLSNIFRLLTNCGKLLIMARNKLAVSRFCGNVYDVAKFSKNDYENMLRNAGFFANFFSVFPNLSAAQLIYSDNYLPNESMQVRYLPAYDDTSKIFYRENALCDDLIKNNALHQFANAFFIECSKTQSYNDLKFVTISFKRNAKRSFVTRGFSDRVEKIAWFDEGVASLVALADNQKYIKEHGINVVDYELKDNVLSCEYIDAPILTKYLTELAYTDKNQFFTLLDGFYNLVCKSSEVIENGVFGPVLKKGFIDLVPLNVFYRDGKFVVFDQEFVQENVPVALIMYRCILILFEKIEIAESLVTDKELFDRYGISKNKDALSKMECEFINGLGDFISNKNVRVSQINENWKKLFNTNWEHLLLQAKDLLIDDKRRHCFDDVENKKIYVWGTGKWANNFMLLHKESLNVVGIIDNNQSAQGTLFCGLKVFGPAVLSQDNNFKVIVCVKNCVEIVSQLLEMGIKEFGLYDANMNYFTDAKSEVSQNKKYHIGYLSGVFDLYHIGHINMFRRAKEMCDYLIVGVTSDEYVINKKKRTPFIPFEERLQVVAACKYVDKAVGVPYMHEEITEAWEKYHYDVQFCGSDYETNPWWLEQQKWLREHGSDLVFFPYTQQTSSTKIKALIDKGLL